MPKKFRLKNAKVKPGLSQGFDEFDRSNETNENHKHLEIKGTKKIVNDRCQIHRRRARPLMKETFIKDTSARSHRLGLSVKNQSVRVTLVIISLIISLSPLMIQIITILYEAHSEPTFLLSSLNTTEEFESDNSMSQVNSTSLIQLVFTGMAAMYFPTVVVYLIKLVKHTGKELDCTKQDLENEQHRTIELLCEMMPVKVALKVRDKEPVPPKNYEAVTIFFSDIVGFTKISSSITPNEVVEMLNSLYQSFDKRIEFFDVYKVETIGDAYMVASGVPTKNGDKHATEIAKMALTLRDTIKQIFIPRTQRPLQLRIGIHTGPVATGVVGLKMPRYCLFGDTVNVASRMESTSIAMYIQISDITARYLENKPEFLLTERGYTPIKGRGLIKTFWLEETTDMVSNSSNSKEDSSIKTI